MEKQDIYQKSYNILGEEHLLAISIEEASELIKSITKYQRNNIKFKLGIEQKDASLLESIADEIADIEITTEQLKQAYNIQSNVELYKTQKLERVVSRLEKYEKLGGEKNV
jgi:NTP pyrophosphatase (non-canonical NTP hydrolase)